jgi:hypothetical protein
MYNYLELIESVGDMSKFKIKNERKYWTLKIRVK